MHSIVANSADLEVRRKAINIVLSMTSSRNVEDVVLSLKKQLQKTQEQEYDKVIAPLPSPPPPFTIHPCRLQNTGNS
jgi:vesicle coat complex subunit